MTQNFYEHTWTATHTSGDTMNGFFYAAFIPIYDSYHLSPQPSYSGGNGWTFQLTGKRLINGDPAYKGTNFIQSYFDSQSNQTVTPYYWNQAASDGSFTPDETDSSLGQNMLEVAEDFIFFNNTWYAIGTTSGAVDLAGGGGGGNGGGGGVTSGTIGTEFVDTLTGTNSADYMYGYGGNDFLYGGDGDDFLFGGDGADLLDGQAGNNSASYYDSPMTVVAFLQNSLASFNQGYAAGDTYLNINNLYGSAYDDTLGGNDLANTIGGFEGNDYLFGYGGNDFLYGGEGNDYLYGMMGIDYYDGGDGYDHLAFLSQQQGAQVYLYGNYIANDGYGNIESAFNVEAVLGTELSDVLFGGYDANVLVGNGGTDYIRGVGGGNYIDGGAGNDLYFLDLWDIQQGSWTTVASFGQVADDYDYIYLTNVASKSDVAVFDWNGNAYMTLVSTGYTGGFQFASGITAADVIDQFDIF